MAGRTATAAYHKRNLAWPLSRTGAGFKQVSLVERYETALRHLVRTHKGAFYADPEYGTVCYRIRTQNMTDALVQACLEDIRRGAARYIPDIIVHDLVTEVDEDAHKFTLSVFWTIRGATQQVHGELAKTQTTYISL
jgi:hypothetical protein